MAVLRRRPDFEALEEMAVLGWLREAAERIGAAADAGKMRNRITELGKRIKA